MTQSGHLHLEERPELCAAHREYTFSRVFDRVEDDLYVRRHAPLAPGRQKRLPIQ